MPVALQILGDLIRESDRTALYVPEAGGGWLPGAETPSGAPGSLHLSFAYVTLGPQAHILPDFILDDWGNEVSATRLYDWVRQNGERFPRAELFGQSQAGEKVQYFLRDLDLAIPLPCYVTAVAGAVQEPPVLINAILLARPGLPAPARVPPPPGAPSPLYLAQLDWWQVDSDRPLPELAQLMPPTGGQAAA